MKSAILLDSVHTTTIVTTMVTEAEEVKEADTTATTEEGEALEEEVEEMGAKTVEVADEGCIAIPKLLGSTFTLRTQNKQSNSMELHGNSAVNVFA